MSDLKLKNGSKIAVIGGGPSGSFFAIHALSLAKELSLEIEIIVFERKTFKKKGQTGCNMCAGVLQESLINSLKEIDIEVSENIIQSRIKGYTFWIKGLSSSVSHEPKRNIITVFRGGKLPGDSNGFDNFILNHAKKLGAKVINENVHRVNFEANNHSPVSIYYNSNKEEMMKVQLLVGAFGVNFKQIDGLPYNYSPPKSWKAFQIEIPLDESYLDTKMHSLINVFFVRPKGVKYLAAVPKGKYLTVSGIGEHVNVDDIKSAISRTKLKDFLPGNWAVGCTCHPFLSAGSANKPFADRFIAIGDAAYSRLLKNGIESAFITSKFAAETVLNHGISKYDFKVHYEIKCKIKFSLDNLFGKMIFSFHDFIMTNRLLSHSYLNLVKQEQKYKDFNDRKFSEVLWHIYTGNISYFKIFLLFFNPVIQLKLISQTVKLFLRLK